MTDYDVLVIGSGAGGLAAALSLARCGKKVLILEQHYLPGGWCHSFSMEGFQFSPGVHYIGQLQPGGRMRTVYEGLGVANDLPFMELNPDGYDHVYLNEDRFDIPKGRDIYAERLKSRFPREAAGIDRYLRTVSEMIKELENETHARGLKGAITLPWRISTLARYGWMSLDAFFDQFELKDPKLRAILAMQAGDHGMGPSRAPAVLHAAVAAHYFDGGYYPKGGGRSIPRAFIRALRKLGGDIKLRAEVSRILLEKNGSTSRVIGVALKDGTEIRADYVVSNADPRITYQRLIGEEHLSRLLRYQLSRTTNSSSCLSLFLATNLDVRAAGLDSGNCWFSFSPSVEDMYSFARSANPFETGELPGLFLTATTLKDPGKRSDGIHTMESFALVSSDSFKAYQHSQYGARPDGYQKLKEELSARMIRQLERRIPGLSKSIVFQSLGSPLTNEHYIAAPGGNLYGTEKRLSQLGPLSFQIKTEIKGLFLCGASTTSHGVAGATFSGIAAAKALLQCRASEILSAKGQSLRIYQSEVTTHYEPSSQRD